MMWGRFEVYVVLFLCGLGDFLTTYAGLSLGGVETRLLGAIPFLGTSIFCLSAYMIQKLSGYAGLKGPLCFGLVLVAFSGLANNLMWLLGVPSLSLLGNS
jgi:hypothetical protein